MVQSILPETFKNYMFLTMFIFDSVLYVCICLHFGGWRHEALAFKSADAVGVLREAFSMFIFYFKYSESVLEFHSIHLLHLY